MHFEFESQLFDGVAVRSGEEDLPPLQTKEIYKELVKVLSSCYGLFAHSIIPNLIVRHVDEESQLCMIRVPRDAANHVRVAITFMTSLYNKGIVASVLAINGSARTARLTTMREIRRRQLIDKQRMTIPSTKEMKRLDARLQIIREIDV